MRMKFRRFHITVVLPAFLLSFLAFVIHINLYVMWGRSRSMLEKRQSSNSIHFGDLGSVIRHDTTSSTRTGVFAASEKHRRQHAVRGIRTDREVSSPQKVKLTVKGSTPDKKEVQMNLPKKMEQKQPHPKQKWKQQEKQKRKQKEKQNVNRKGKQKEKRKGGKDLQVIEPRPLSLVPNATFSACLLVRDDNNILPEWLAYHYHTLGLRDLIVAVDPLSQESPSEILMKWRLMTNLRVLEWSDADFMPDVFLVEKRPPDKYMQKPEDFPDPEALLEVSNHRYRQRVFLAKCLRRFRKDGRSWVLHTDTDEFIVPSKLLRQMKPKYLTIPSIEEPNSVLTLLQEAVKKTPIQVHYPCLSLLRLLFGSVESTQAQRELDVPKPFRADRFETLRWRYHALPHNMTLHGNPKVLLDVAAIPERFFAEDLVFSVHRPVKRFCRVNTELSFSHFKQQPIGVNHYLGTWERYARRHDKRRTRAVYDAKASVRRGTDDGLRLWLKGFCTSVGQQTANTLLGKSYSLSTADNSTNS